MSASIWRGGGKIYLELCLCFKEIDAHEILYETKADFVELSMLYQTRADVIH
jgi:hypothetical protein